MIRAHRETSQAKVLLPFGQNVGIEQNLFGRIQAAMLAALNGIRVAFLGSRVIEIIVTLHRHRNVRLLNAAEDLSIQVLLKRLRLSRHVFGVAILRFQVRNHVGIGSIAQPEVIVDARFAITRDFLRDDFGGRRLDYWLSSFPM